MANRPIVLFLNDEFVKVSSNAENIDFLTVNGRDIAADGADLDAHLASTANPHSVTKAQVGLGNVTNDAQLKEADLDDDEDLTADSATKIPSQRAVKAYVDGQVGGSGAFSDSAFRVQDNGDATKQMAFEVSAITTGTTRTITMPDAAVNLGLIASAIQSSEKGANSGVATLDGGGKIPASQLPNSVMELQGAWNANTNIPALADGVVNAGDVYEVTVAGSQDLGSGSLSFDVGDFVIYGASAVWYKSDSTDAVASVNGQTGVVSLDSDDIDEGSTNLYFTAAAAQAATISQVITNGVTTKAPSEDAVFDALAGKSNTGHSHVAADISDFAAEALAAAVGDAIANGEAKAPSQNAVFDALALKQDVISASDGVKKVGVNVQRDDALAFTNDNAGAITVRQAVYVKANGAVDLVIDTTAALNVKMIGLVEAASIAATESGLISLRAGALIGGFTGLTPSAPVYIGATAGATTQTAPTGAGTTVYQLGMAVSATQILFMPRHIIVNA